MPVSFWPMLIMPADSACAEETAVASGIAVGTPSEDGASVAAVDGVSPPVEGAGVAVAEDPQATRRAATNRINT